MGWSVLVATRAVGGLSAAQCPRPGVKPCALASFFIGMQIPIFGHLLFYLIVDFRVSVFQIRIAPVVFGHVTNEKQVPTMTKLREVPP